MKKIISNSAPILIIGIGIVVFIAIAGYFSESDHVPDDDHDHSVEIEGKDVRSLTIQEVADLWEIDSEILLSRVITEFDLKGSYTVNTVLDDIREAEYKFSPALIKDMAEEIKTGNTN